MNNSKTINSEVNEFDRIRTVALLGYTIVDDFIIKLYDGESLIMKQKFDFFTAKLWQNNGRL